MGRLIQILTSKFEGKNSSKVEQESQAKSKPRTGNLVKFGTNYLKPSSILNLKLVCMDCFETPKQQDRTKPLIDNTIRPKYSIMKKKLKGTAVLIPKFDWNSLSTDEYSQQLQGFQLWNTIKWTTGTCSTKTKCQTTTTLEQRRKHQTQLDLTVLHIWDRRSESKKKADVYFGGWVVVNRKKQKQRWLWCSQVLCPAATVCVFINELIAGFCVFCVLYWF